MTDQPQTRGRNVAGARDIAKWLRTAQQLADRSGCVEAVEPALQAAAEAQRDGVSIAFIGSTKAGKSNLINQVLGRRLLITRVRPVNAEIHILSVPKTDGETVRLAGDPEFTPLVEANLESLIDSPQAQERGLEWRISNDWLADHDYRIIERTARNDAEAIPDNSQRLLKDVDTAVLVIDALMPFKKSEAELLRECARRGQPAIVAITKLDQLSPEERREVISYVDLQVNSCSSSIPTLPISATGDPAHGAGDPVHRIDQLKSTIDSLVVDADVRVDRRRQIVFALLDSLEAIASAAQAGWDAQQKDEVERDREIKRQQQQIDSQNLIWPQLEQKLQQRRQGVDAMIRDHLAENRKIVLEGILHELEISNDVKTWWTRDLPFRLQREFRSIAGQLSASINRRIGADLRWIQEELNRQFGYPLPTLTDANVAIGEVGIVQNEVRLSDSNMLRIVSRVGTATTVIAAGTLLATAGVGGAALAASVVASLAAEQLIRRNTKQDQEKVRGELAKVVERAELEYASDVSRKLTRAYDTVIVSLKQHQLRWQQAQLQALLLVKNNSAGTGGETDWKSLVDSTTALIAEISSDAKPAMHAAN